ncbi:MAG: hypothetical protein SNI45_06595 [Rikenellaceae bacterium]
MPHNKNYILFTPFTALLVVVILSVLSLLPPFNFYNIRLKQANIYSGVVSDSLIRELFGLRYISLDDSTSFENLAYIDSLITLPDTCITTSAPTLWEDYSPEKQYSTRFREKLMDESGERVRIAFMGDSFIEGDILTMDLREMLQARFTGGGVGFVPITSQVAAYRGTIKHTFSRDWRSACITQQREEQRYLLSGYEFYPEEGSWVEYERRLFREHAKQINSATLLYRSNSNARVSISINGNPAEIYECKASDKLQRITIEQPITTIRYSFESSEGMVLYGTLLDYIEPNGSKVSLDNYAIRGNSGIHMNHIDPTLAAQFDRIAPLSLIVVQYGVNVSGQENYSYAKYGNHLFNLIKHLKECYPDCAIAIMGVSDRCTLQGSEAVTMPTIVALDNIERQVAQSAGVIYFSTLQTMCEMGGMGEFVKNGWANKDYTHINTLGGMKVAERLYIAITTP